jgi:hypothetical protein
VLGTTPKVAKAPVISMPLIYLDGKCVSEHEWERSKRIKQNKEVLARLELNNVRKQLFGNEVETKGKENKKMVNKPPKGKGQKVPLVKSQK